MFCTCGKEAKMQIVGINGENRLGYKCSEHGTVAVLTDDELDERNLAVCRFCNGTGSVKLKDTLYYKHLTKGVKTNRVMLMPSFSSGIDPESLVGCETCEGKGWYETADWSTM